MPAYVFKRSQRHRRRRKSELHPTLVERKRLGYIEQLGIHKGGRQEKAGRYFRTVRKSVGAKNESLNS